MSYTGLIEAQVNHRHLTDLKSSVLELDTVTSLSVNDRQSADDFQFMRFDPEIEPALWESAGRRRLERLIGQNHINRISVEIARRNFIQIRGLPTDSFPPPTPYDHDPYFHNISIALANLFGLIGALNLSAFAFDSENDGQIVRHVAPRLDSSEEMSSHGWKQELSWHIDGAYRPLEERISPNPAGLSPAPEWLLWGVIYDTPEVPITLVSIDELVLHLPAKAIADLQKPEFDVQSPDSFGDIAVTSGVPLLIPDPRGGYFSRYNQLKCTGLTSDADNALRTVAATLRNEKLVNRLAIKSGDNIIIHNWKMLHMRSPFTPLWSGKDRWLLRIYAAVNANCGMAFSPARPRVWR
jgi:L-asparagine oxygenase